MQLYPHLTFDGQCEAAFKFYEKCLHGSITLLMTYENTPMALQTPPEWQSKVSHATFAVAEYMCSGSDTPPGQYQDPQGFALQFNLDDPVEAERVFEALSENGTVRMPLQQTFWALRFGEVIDQFGFTWMINCERLTGQTPGIAAPPAFGKSNISAPPGILTFVLNDNARDKGSIKPKLVFFF